MLVLVAVILMRSCGRWASYQVEAIAQLDCWRLRWGKSPFDLCPFGLLVAFLNQVEPYQVEAFLFGQLAFRLGASFQLVDHLQPKPTSCASSDLPCLVVQLHLPYFTIYSTAVAIYLHSDQSSTGLKLVPFPSALQRYRPCSFWSQLDFVQIDLCPAVLRASCSS